MVLQPLFIIVIFVIFLQVQFFRQLILLKLHRCNSFYTFIVILSNIYLEVWFMLSSVCNILKSWHICCVIVFREKFLRILERCVNQCVRRFPLINLLQLWHNIPSWFPIMTYSLSVAGRFYRFVDYFLFVKYIVVKLLFGNTFCLFALFHEIIIQVLLFDLFWLFLKVFGRSILNLCSI